MQNYTILQRNILSSLENEEAKSSFLAAQEQPGNDTHSYNAEKFAREVDRLCSVLKPLIGQASKPFEANNDVQSDVLAFILKRHWHLRYSRH